MSHNNRPDIEFDESVNEIIDKYIIYAMTAAAIPVPAMDIAAVTAVQLKMIDSLANEFETDYQEDIGKSLILAFTGASIPKIGASLIKIIPGFGTIAGTGAQVILSGASTYALGQVFAAHFQSGGDVWDLDPSDFTDLYAEFFRIGRKRVKASYKKMESEKTHTSDCDDLPKEETPKELTKLEKLFALYEKGAITKDEYEALKKKFL